MLVKTEILSDNKPNTSNSDNSEVEDDIENLQLLINELPIANPLNMKEYINIDDKLVAKEKLILEKIVNIVRG
ncbi:hypothetical protein GLOIN_2v1765309 [Rhizophagus clarus]|uniref:Uncharacterized protein n=1 Tax=Rhizophagus clarus TaxID=94130 RepID=A0A8H3KY58_9GLOM|nr:hypothetical protein GLOIN_2v1765309 [Rhizophagus clarus]